MERIKQTRHGFHGTKVYKLWASMVGRCETKTKQNYKYYGGSGIKVCNEWRNNPESFCKWALSNGYSDGMCIDRIDNTKDYSPENCQFITHKENCSSGKRRLFSNNKTGHRGISVSKSGSFEVYDQIDGKQKYIGCRKTLDEAITLRSEIIGNIHNPHKKP